MREEAYTAVALTPQQSNQPLSRPTFFFFFFYETVGASPPGIEIACSLRATERKGSEKRRFERLGEISPPDRNTMRKF